MKPLAPGYRASTPGLAGPHTLGRLGGAPLAGSSTSMLPSITWEDKSVDLPGGKAPSRPPKASASGPRAELPSPSPKTSAAEVEADVAAAAAAAEAAAEKVLEPPEESSLTESEDTEISPWLIGGGVLAALGLLYAVSR